MLDLVLYAVAGFFIALFGTSIGLALGVLRLPIILMIGLPAGIAAGTNIGVTAISSGIGSLGHIKAGRLDHRLMVTMGIPAMVGSFAGGFLGGMVPTELLLILISVVVCWQGIMLFLQGYRQRRLRDNLSGSDCDILEPEMPRRVLSIEVFLGVSIGFLGAMVGVALGVMRLPAMIQVLKVEPGIAVGTTLAIGFLSGVFGMIGRLVHGQVDFLILIVMGVTAGIGSYYGARLTGKIRPDVLRMLIGLVLVVSAAGMLHQASA